MTILCIYFALIFDSKVIKTIMKIKKEVLAKLRMSPGIRGRICAATGKSYPTVQRWVEENAEGLTLEASLKVIREELNLTNDEILEQEEKTAA